MKQTIKLLGYRFWALLLALFQILHSKVAFAQSSVDDGLQRVGQQAGFPQTGLTSSTTVLDLVANIIDILLFVAGAIAVLFIIIGGFWYITSGGSEEQAKKGRRTLINALLGLAIVILSYVIINVLVDFVSNT